MKKLQAVMKAILLRRTKNSQIDGKPILTLPEKTEEIVYAIFNEDEQAYYTALETKTLIQFNKYVKAGTIGKNYSNVMVLLLRLRQAACHPHLIMDFEEAPPEASIEDIETWAKALPPDVVRRIIEAVVPFECPVCYDSIPNPRILIPCGHDICSKCLATIANNVQQEPIVEGNEAGGPKCPNCRGKVDGKKIIDYKTFRTVHIERDDLAAEDEEDGESTEDSLDSKSKFISMAMLKKEAIRSKEGHRRYNRYLNKDWVSSAKVDKCLEILRDTDLDVKTIVFSQFTTLLDLLEILIRKKWGFMRYDGSMSADARHHSVVKFTNDPRCKVMLVSLKAGNAGLNLVAASQVIIIDPFW
jgi:SNF2 family DNA or RNA helicase